MSEIFNWANFSNEFSKAASAKGFTRELIAETEDGEILGWERKGSGSDAPTIYISAGMHGDEPAGPLGALRLMEEGKLPEDYHVLVCPALNPGGLALGTRENRVGYDLNRDYLLFQTEEIAAHAKWLCSKPVPDLFVSLHEDWETTGFYFYEINLGKDEPKWAEELLQAVLPCFPAEPGPEIDGHDVREPGWIYHHAEADLPDSWPEAIYLAKKGCPLSFTLETPSQAALEKRVEAHVLGSQALIARFMKSYPA